MNLKQDLNWPKRRYQLVRDRETIWLIRAEL
jgi:hypothetical protein